MATPSIQTLVTDAQQVLNLDSISAVRSVVAVALANANVGTPLNPNLTTQQLWNEFYQVITKPKSDIESIIANQLMKFLFAPPAPGGVGANGQVIFNDGGVLAGDAGLTYNKTTDTLTVLGNVGVGVTPSPWISFQKGIDFGGAGNYGSVSARANFAAFATNCYFDGTNWVYKNNNPANLYEHSAGLHIWRYAAAGTGNITFTQGMTLDASGRLLVGPTSANANGGILQLSSGVTFPATQVTSSDANTLDDYEEGTWTGTLAGGTTNPTIPVTATGQYTKIGNQVFARILFSNVITTGASGAITVTGLPFANGSNRTIGSVLCDLIATFTGNPICWVGGTGTTLSFQASNSNGAASDLTHNAGTGRYFYSTIVYTV